MMFPPLFQGRAELWRSRPFPGMGNGLLFLGPAEPSFSAIPTWGAGFLSGFTLVPLRREGVREGRGGAYGIRESYSWRGVVLITLACVSGRCSGVHLHAVRGRRGEGGYLASLGYLD